MSTNLEAIFCDTGWSEEYDCIPLRLRSKMLHSIVSNQCRVDAAAAAATAAVLNAVNQPICNEMFLDQNQDKDRNHEQIQIVKKPDALIVATTSEFQNPGGSECGSRLSFLDKISSSSVDCSGEYYLERTSRVSCMSTDKVPYSEVVCQEKQNDVIDELVNKGFSVAPIGIQKDCLVASTSVHVQGKKLKHETIYGFDDSLDNVVLGERRRMLLTRKLIQSSGSYIVPIVEHKNIEEMSNSSNAEKGTADIERRESDSIQCTQITKILNSASSTCDGESRGNSFPLSFELRAPPTAAECRSYGTQEINATDSLVLPSLAKVKDEPIDDTSELYDEGGESGIQDCTTSSEILCVKSEPSFFELVGDKLDHLPLIDRVKMLSSGAFKPNIVDNLESLKTNVDTGTRMPESISISRPLKRRRTATNSVETALEEDAPELLKVLRESGILVDEMKLYGQEDSDGELDDSLDDDGFSELEAVISQLFCHRQTFLKFPLLHTKGAKISYCLACLLSLVEQTRFLRNRKWPVEWGWCRDLQSFIFVFHRHNRIVLERPEYGYATYFFELLNSAPAAWQIKRLVTALKLTSCGRITLMENKPLVVGEDLSEGEARVLAEYGWTPNTGLGTMLNYCDRVVHDRKNEMNSSEWRSKIGKQLMNGYNGGNIVSKNLLNQSKEDEYLLEDEDEDEDEDVDVQVKLEQCEHFIS